MSSAEHTATPWGLCHHLKSPEHDASCQCGYRGSIWGADGEHIVLEMGSSPDHDGEGKLMGHTMPQADRATQLADAAFIVTAVNGYDALVKALERSVVAIDDWLNLYASEHCNADRVAEAKARTNENGTLWYIASIQEANRAALRDAKERKE